jgi:Zn-dependent protease
LHIEKKKGASFNAWIAMFNLLPFGVLDGQKIFDWNKIVWTSAMIATMILFICIHAKLALFLILNPIIREFYRRRHELKISRDVSNAMAAALEQVNS